MPLRHASLVVLLAALGAVAAATGCAAPYAPMGPAGGYEHQQLDERVFRVRFRGSGARRAHDLALLRAAEIGVQLGYTHLVVRGSEYEDGTRAVTGATTVLSGHGPYAHAYTTPTYTTSRPGQAIVVEFFDGPPPDRVLEVHACRDLVEELRSFYGLGPPSR
jgi:hypothetical protein